MAANVASLLQKLGLPDAPTTRNGVIAVLGYFDEHLKIDPMEWVGYLRGIDFHKNVWLDWIEPGTKLSRHRYDGPEKLKPFLYLTQPGTSQFSTGTSFDRSVYELFEFDKRTRTLVSFASDISFGLNPGTKRFDTAARRGGGIQYIVAAADKPRQVAN